MPVTEMVVTVAIAAAGMLLLIALLRLFATLSEHKTIRKAVESNPQLAESLIEKAGSARGESVDERVAIILVAIGLAMIGAPLIAVDDPGMVRFAIGASLFPLLVGAALWLRLRASEWARRRDRSE